MRIEQALLHWSNKAYGKEDLFKIASIMMYEAVDVAKEQTRLDDYPSESDIRNINIRVNLGDVLAMHQLFCSMTGRDFYTLYMEGCQRAIERCKEKLEGKDGF